MIFFIAIDPLENLRCWNINFWSNSRGLSDSLLIKNNPANGEATITAHNGIIPFVVRAPRATQALGENSEINAPPPNFKWSLIQHIFLTLNQPKRLLSVILFSNSRIVQFLKNLCIVLIPHISPQFLILLLWQVEDCLLNIQNL